jgi:hypothetical protein
MNEINMHKNCVLKSVYIWSEKKMDGGKQIGRKLDGCKIQNRFVESKVEKCLLL